MDLGDKPFVEYDFEQETDLAYKLINEGYKCVMQKPGRGMCGLEGQLFTVGLFIGLTDKFRYGRYCYHSWLEAMTALMEWDGKEDPPGNWIVYKGRDGRRDNPNYIQPDLFK